jgi:hypothetical protein
MTTKKSFDDIDTCSALSTSASALVDSATGVVVSASAS